MKVIVDTSIWSLAFRRKKLANDENENRLKKLILESNVILIGPIRQEILSGIKDKKQFERLKNNLKTFSDFSITQNDYETAAEFFNLCRTNGIQGSNTDFLICAIACNNNFLIFTSDKDFDNYKEYLPINFY